MSGFDKVVWLIAVALLLPVLATPAGWAFGIALAIAWLIAAYGGRYLLDLEKHRREGERGLASNVRSQARNQGGDE